MDKPIEAVKPELTEGSRKHLREWIVGRLAAGMTKFLVHKTTYIGHNPTNYAVTIHCNQGMFNFKLNNDQDEAEADAVQGLGRKELFDFIALVNKIEIID